MLDSGAVRDLFDARWPAAVRPAGLLGADDPEDVVADSFARLYVRRSTVRSLDAAAGYVTRTIVNLVRDRARRRRLAAREPVRAFAADTDEVTHGDTDIADAVHALAPRQREAVVLRYWLDMSEADMAAAMAISVGTVKTHLARGLAAQRPVLEKSRHEQQR